jgi:predicted dehydrogenase
MDTKVRWGVLGAAKIAVEKVIPSMQRGRFSEITAIASRDIGKAEHAALKLGIPKAYGSYKEILADPDIDAIYNPLPNHLHVPWSVKAAKAGKHVLCEKPLSVTVDEALSLLEARDRAGVKIMEAFMIRSHPQWSRIIDIVRSGKIGTVRSVMGYFCYNNLDSENVRNILKYGGGGLLDIGCYLIYSSRLIFGDDPTKVIGLLRRDPAFKTDILTSAILDFNGAPGHAVFTCSTQAVPNQRIHVLGTTGRLEVEVPFTPSPDQTSRIYIDDGATLPNRNPEVIEFEPCDQYTLQGDIFSKAILGDTELPLSLEESVMNMAVIEALFRSAASGTWESPAEILSDIRSHRGRKRSK